MRLASRLRLEAIDHRLELGRVDLALNDGRRQRRPAAVRTERTAEAVVVPGLAERVALARDVAREHAVGEVVDVLAPLRAGLTAPHVSGVTDRECARRDDEVVRHDAEERGAFALALDGAADERTGADLERARGLLQAALELARQSIELAVRLVE